MRRNRIIPRPRIADTYNEPSSARVIIYDDSAMVSGAMNTFSFGYGDSGYLDAISKLEEDIVKIPKRFEGETV